MTVNETATLVGRYWLNEAFSGQVPDTVFDDQPSPLNLGVTYDANVNWTLDNGHRGLGASVTGHGGIASAPIAGTKYETNLDRATQATMVVVMEWGAGNGDRMAGFQQSDGTRTLQVLTKSGGDLELRFDGIVESPRIYWPGTWDDGVRRVFHIVYDTYDPIQDDRVRMYVDGVDQGTPSFTSGAMPPLADSLDFSDPTNVLALLNEPDLTNGLPGTVFYYAVYTGEMTDAEITSDYTALSADDDNINPPTVAAAIPDTTVADSSPAIDNYRDLKAVFTDAEDGSALTYSIESNTNSGLVTATIVPADSTLDLSFTASNSGTATITVRATDSSLLFVEDVFTVTVSCPAGSVCWDGGAGGGNPEWSNGLNWTGDAVPGSADDVVFNGLSSNPATFDVTDQIGSLTIEASYGGTITQGTGAVMTIGSGGFTQNGGTFTGGDANISVEGQAVSDGFTLTGGAFTSTSATLDILQDMTISGGSFSANGGTIQFGGSTNDSNIDPGGSVFNHVIFAKTGTGNKDVNITSPLDVNGDLTLNVGSGNHKLLGSTINVAGDVLGTAWGASYSGGGDTNIKRSSPELCVKVRGSSSMLLLGCLGDLLRFEKREIQVATFAPDRSSP